MFFATTFLFNNEAVIGPEQRQLAPRLFGGWIGSESEEGGGKLP